MTCQMQLKDFLRRYFGVFIGAFFASIIAVAWTFALAWSSYCRNCAQDGLFPWAFMACLRCSLWAMAPWCVGGLGVPG